MGYSLILIDPNLSRLGLLGYVFCHTPNNREAGWQRIIAINRVVLMGIDVHWWFLIIVLRFLSCNHMKQLMLFVKLPASQCIFKWYDATPECSKWSGQTSPVNLTKNKQKIKIFKNSTNYYECGWFSSGNPHWTAGAVTHYCGATLRGPC